MRPRGRYRPPPRPDAFLTPVERDALLGHARIALREAWYVLVAAGRMSDAAEVKRLRERLDSASGVVSPPAPEAVQPDAVRK